MNKSKIAVGVVVALGIIWTGGAWYTGKQLEQRKDTLIDYANSQLNKMAPEARLQVSYQDYQRNLFSSHAKLVVQASSQTEDNTLLKPGQTIVFNETIDHGPFPFAQLKKGNLIPAMASVHSELENTEALKALFEASKGVSVIQADTRIGYGGDTSSAIRLLPLDYHNSESGQRFAWNEGKLNVAADADGNKVSFDGDIDSIAITTKNQLDLPVLFTLNGLKTSADTHLNPQGVRIGSQDIDLQKLSASVNGQDAMTVEGLKGSSRFDSNDKAVSGQVDYTVANVKMQNQSFGEGKLSLKLANLDGAALKTFSENYNAQAQALLSQPGLAENPQQYQEAMNQLLLANLPTLLKGDPIISIAPLSWKNDKGESSFNLNVQFKDPATADGQAQNINQAADRVVKSLDSKLLISMDMATELMTHVALAEGHPQDQASKLAEQQVKGLAAMGQMFKLTTQQDGNIVNSLQFANGEVTMNGEKMPLDQFLSRYMLGGMGASPEGLPGQ